jgi:hypothetical protein
MRDVKDRIHVEFTPASELTLDQIERLIGYGKTEADLLDQLEEATRAGDRDLAWQISVALLRNIEASGQVVVKKD